MPKPRQRRPRAIHIVPVEFPAALLARVDAAVAWSLARGLTGASRSAVVRQSVAAGLVAREAAMKALATMPPSPARADMIMVACGLAPLEAPAAIETPTAPLSPRLSPQRKRNRV